MNASFWHERWQRAEVGFHQQEVNAQLRKYWDRLALPAGAPVLVPLCGKTLDLLWLAGEGHPVTGVELSPLAVDAFFREHGLQATRSRSGAFEVWAADEIRILLGDFFDLEPGQVADCVGVYDRAALIALPPPMRERYVRHLLTIVPPAIRMLLMTLEYDQGLRPGPPFAVGEAEVRALYEPALTVEMLYSRDALAEVSAWREQGLTWLQEKVYRLA